MRVGPVSISIRWRIDRSVCVGCDDLFSSFWLYNYSLLVSRGLSLPFLFPIFCLKFVALTQPISLFSLIVGRRTKKCHRSFQLRNRWMFQSHYFFYSMRTIKSVKDAGGTALFALSASTGIYFITEND